MRLGAILIAVACACGGDAPVSGGDVAKASPVLVGIEGCDRALAELQTCIETRAPGDAQASAREALTEMRDSYRKRAEAEDAAVVEQECVAAVGNYARSNSAWGCGLASAAVFDAASCDQELAEARKCVEASELDADAKQLASETLLSLSELWAAQSKLPEQRRQVACKSLLSSIAKVTADAHCP